MSIQSYNGSAVVAMAGKFIYSCYIAYVDTDSHRDAMASGSEGKWILMCFYEKENKRRWKWFIYIMQVRCIVDIAYIMKWYMYSSIHEGSSLMPSLLVSILMREIKRIFTLSSIDLLILYLALGWSLIYTHICVSK